MSSDVCTMADFSTEEKREHLQREEDRVRNEASIIELERKVSAALQDALALVRLISSNVSGASHTEKKQPSPVGCLRDAMVAQCEDVACLCMELHRIIAVLGCDR